MKKVLFLFCLLLTLTSCTKSETFDKEYQLETYDCDMSAYKGMTSTNHHFKGTTVSELKRCLEEKGSGIFILSRTACSHCQVIIQHVNAVAEKLDLSVYYIDAESSIYPIIGTDDYDVLYNLLYDVLAESDGEKELMTPHLFTIINGKFVSSLVGYPYDNDFSDSAMSKLEKTYEKMMKAFAE